MPTFDDFTKLLTDNSNIITNRIHNTFKCNGDINATFYCLTISTDPPWWGLRENMLKSLKQSGTIWYVVFLSKDEMHVLSEEKVEKILRNINITGTRDYKIHYSDLPIKETLFENYYDLVSKINLADGLIVADTTIWKDQSKTQKYNLNTILFGPPGSGKTYSAIPSAVSIADPVFFKKYAGLKKYSTAEWIDIKEKFDLLSKDGQIEFVTFHQSYSYEEFIEGLKPVINPADSGVNYEVKNGVFKRLCQKASLQKKITIENDGVIMDLTKELFETFYFDFSSKLPEQSETKSTIILKTPTGMDFHLFKNSSKSVVVKAGSMENAMSVAFSELYNVLFNSKSPTYLSYEPKIIESIMEGKKMKIHEYDNSAKNFVLVIDEINRGNISKIFGELITLIEKNKRSSSSSEYSETIFSTLPYSGDKFAVPENVYILGTMNTADRSIALLDIALRRRFEFIELLPDPSLLNTIESNIDLEQLLTKLNKRIEYLLDRDHIIGHSFFMKASSLSVLCGIFSKEIIPLLQEYFYGDYEKIKKVLNDYPSKIGNDSFEFITTENIISSNLFKNLEEELDEKKIYSVAALTIDEKNKGSITEAFIRIYK